MVDSVQYDPSADATRVAIACQGGGSDTAFTAGILRALLTRADWTDQYRLVGISGTSGGAFNALATWYGLVTDGPSKAATLLEQLWDELAADDTTDRLLTSECRQYYKFGASGRPFRSSARIRCQDRNADRIGFARC